jgi:hypothetical protein
LIKVSLGFLGENIRLYEFLWGSSIPMVVKNSMYSLDLLGVFRFWFPFECKAKGYWLRPVVGANILFAFWSQKTREQKLAVKRYQLPSRPDRTLADAMFETIVETLKLGNATA